jgi:hypothetical protein
VRANYVLPIRWSDDDGLDELTDYLGGLPGWVQLIVVDGSPGELFERHAEAILRASRRGSRRASRTRSRARASKI